jgi:hypothetical protein
MLPIESVRDVWPKSRDSDPLLSNLSHYYTQKSGNLLKRKSFYTFSFYNLYIFKKISLHI